MSCYLSVSDKTVALTQPSCGSLCYTLVDVFRYLYCFTKKQDELLASQLLYRTGLSGITEDALFEYNLWHRKWTRFAFEVAILKYTLLFCPHVFWHGKANHTLTCTTLWHFTARLQQGHHNHFLIGLSICFTDVRDNFKPAALQWKYFAVCWTTLSSGLGESLDSCSSLCYAEINAMYPQRSWHPHTYSTVEHFCFNYVRLNGQK